MTGNEYQELAMRTNDGYCQKRLLESIDKSSMSEFLRNVPEHNISDLLNGALGLSGEAGEVTDIVKKIVFHKHPIDIYALEKELGDVLWYVAMCCNALNIEIEDVMQKNIDKLRKRYPDGFDTNKSINRME